MNRDPWPVVLADMLAMGERTDALQAKVDAGLRTCDEVLARLTRSLYRAAYGSDIEHTNPPTAEEPPCSTPEAEKGDGQRPHQRHTDATTPKPRKGRNRSATALPDQRQAELFD